MIANRTSGGVVKKSTLTGKKARVAAKAAKKAYANKMGSRAVGWKKGGREWSRVLGHFGFTASDSSEK